MSLLQQICRYVARAFSIITVPDKSTKYKQNLTRHTKYNKNKV